MTHELSGVLPSGLRFGVSKPDNLIEGLGLAIGKFFVSSIDDFLDHVLLLNFFAHECQMEWNKKIMGTIFGRRIKPLQKGWINIFISNHFINIGKLINFKQNTYLKAIEIIKGRFFLTFNCMIN